MSATEPHQARELAESFGADADRYHRTRPSYPRELIRRIVAASPGPEVLDVGCGTGISTRRFRDAGCHVIGVDVDGRMAELARRGGIEVEVAKFEEWDPAGRAFDAVVAGQTWHWIHPVAAAARAAEALRPGGRLAAFWNVQEPPAGIAEAFAAVYRRVLPDSPFYKPGLDAYGSLLDKAADGIRAAGAYGEPERWRVDWERPYTRDEWLDVVPTSGGHNRFPPGKLEALLEGLGAVVDAAGGSFTMGYAAMAVTARRD